MFKKIAIKTGVLTTVFILAVIVSSYVTNRGNTDMSADMGGATLPRISFMTEGYEVNRQIANETLAPLFSYGLIKERMAALVTDAMRAEYLKREGYDTQILEFIDMEHTPKNILIRAIYTGNKGKNTEAIRTCEEMLHIDPMLGRLLDQQNEEGEKGV